MSLWASVWRKGDAVSIIGTDADPNVTPPTDTFESPAKNAYDTEREELWLWAKEGTPTVTVWIRDETMGRWLPLVTGQALSATAPTKIGGPQNSKMFVQVTAASTATRIVAGWV